MDVKLVMENESGFRGGGLSSDAQWNIMVG